MNKIVENALISDARNRPVSQTESAIAVNNIKMIIHSLSIDAKSVNITKSTIERIFPNNSELVEPIVEVVKQRLQQQ